MTDDSSTPRFLFSVRSIVAVMAFFGYALQYMLKINLGIAIVCMVNHTAVQHTKSLEAESNDNLLVNQTIQEVNQVNCLFKEDTSGGSSMEGEFNWSTSLQGFILASYFYGYIITQIPGGWLAAKYGGKNVIVVSNILASILTITTPYFARWDYKALAICRFLIGIAHGAFWPAMSAVFVYWAPGKERTKIVGSSTSGAWFGNIVALPLGGFLCVYGFDFQYSSGWPSIFYVFGFLGLLWSIVFIIVISDSPKDHWFISDEEKDYILRETVKERSARERGPLKTPWGKIFTSKVCWATFIAHFCNNWGNYMFLTQLPSFMRDVLKFNIKSNGTMSAIPYIACALVTVTFGVVSDKVIRSKFLTKTQVRKIFNGLGLGVPMIGVFCLAFVDCSMPYLGVVFLTLGMAFNGFYWSGGPLVNINDIAGSFAGVIFGIANSFGTVPGIVCPYIVGLLTKNQLQEEWQIVFFIAAAIYFVGATIFWIFGNSDMQSWAVVEDNQNTKKSSDE